MSANNPILIEDDTSDGELFSSESDSVSTESSLYDSDDHPIANRPDRSNGVSVADPIVVVEDNVPDYIDVIDERTSNTLINVPQVNLIENCTRTDTGQPLTSYQKNVIKYILYYPAMLLIFKMGSGKTAAALCSAENMLAMGICRKVIVVGPMSVLPHWQSEALAWGCRRTLQGLTVATYTNFARHFGRRDLEGALLIYDEAHNLANYDREDARNLLAHLDAPSRILLLTGTPVVNRPSDMAILFKILNPGLYSEPLSTFDDMFGENGLGGTDTRSRLREQHHILRDIATCQILFYAPNDDHPDFASIRFHNVIVPFTNIQDNAYTQEFGGGQIGNTRSRGWNAFLNKARRAMNVYNGRPTPKIKMVADAVMKQYRENKKCLIYSEWIDAGIEMVAEALTARRVRFGQITGASSIRQRRDIIDQYNEGQIRVLLISSALSEGVDLKETDYVHILEQAWNTEKLAQVIGRARRKFAHANRNAVVEVYYYFTKGTRLDADDYADQWLANAAMIKHEVNSRFVKKIIRWSKQRENCLGVFEHQHITS